MKCKFIYSDLDQFKHFAKARFKLYIHRYIAYARLRGYKSFNDWSYHRRGFIECWAEPGFHKFWQVWNPGITYFVFRLYLKLGGNKNWIIATFLSFFINGIVHSVIFYMISRQWSFVIPTLFTLFGILVITSKLLDKLLHQNRWPWIMNSVINISLVILSFDACFKLNDILNYFFQIGA
jgi:hypothetical protein